MFASAHLIVPLHVHCLSCVQ